MIRQIFLIIRDYIDNLLLINKNDKITVIIPTNYITDDVIKINEWIINDVKEQLYEKLKEDLKLEKYCAKHKWIISAFEITDKQQKNHTFTITRAFHYYDKTIFFSNKEGQKELIRLKKLKRLIL